MLSNPASGVIVWYDFICPFCYLGLQRTRILAESGFDVVELPFQAHPEIPIEGILVGPRTGPMYDFLAHEAADAGLALHWQPRLPNSRLALTAAEWVRRNEPESFSAVHRSLFEAHFVNREDIGDPSVVDQYLNAVGLEPERFWGAVSDASAEQWVTDAEAMGRANGVSGTPAWLIGGQLMDGLGPVSEFRKLAGAQQQSVI